MGVTLRYLLSGTPKPTQTTMTANQLIMKLQEEVSQLSTGDIPIVCNLVECDVDAKVMEDGRGFYLDLTIKYH